MDALVAFKSVHERCVDRVGAQKKLTKRNRCIYFGYMTKTVLNVKTDVEVKREAQKLAKAIGVPLSIVVNAHLKRFIDERRFEIQAPLIPSAGLKKIIAQAKKDWKAGNRRSFSPAFDNSEDAIAWLNKNS